jgi:hypothetical protein
MKSFLQPLRIGVCVLLVAATVVALTAGAATASAATIVEGPTTTTICHFDPESFPLGGQGITFCATTEITVVDEGCFSEGYRRYVEVRITWYRTYRGNVVLPGLNGVEVVGDTSDVIRPNANLIEEYSFPSHGDFLVADPSCT